MEIRDKMLSVLQPLGGKEEVEELRDTIESGWWAKGPKLQSLKKNLQRWWVQSMQSQYQVQHMVRI